MIRQAELADFDAITRIRESTALNVSRIQDANYRVEIERSGFLLPTDLSIEDFQADLPNYIIAEQEVQVVGYLCLRGTQSKSLKEGAFWLRPELESIYFSQPHAAINWVGVLPEAKKHGLATDMLHAAEQQVRAQHIPWLFSAIVMSPVTNIASLLFHEKNGFERIALTEPTYDHGMDGFQNLYYGKQLS